ncbi:MAG TPA: tetratricopeptide repeat protein [Leptolyngbyaceae cyanobacterium]|jgi:tetratricopeptide (TPR) repeat protein
MTISQLDSALSRYEAAIAVLEKPKFDVTLEGLIFRSRFQPISPILWFIVVLYRTQVERAGILSALIARNAVQSALSDISQIPQEKLITIIELDSRLKEQTKFVIKKVELADWCASFNPPKEAWWWFPETPSHWLDSFDWLWKGMTGISLTVSLSFGVDIVSRFLNSGPGLLSSFAAVLPSVLTLLTAGSVFTEGGQKCIEQIFSRFGIPRYLWEEFKLLLSLPLLVSLIFWKASLPQMADYFNEQGFNNYHDNNWDKARSDYELAISLDPDNAKAHHNLGRLYENLQELDKAKTEYRLAAQGDMAVAYSDLARLYLLQKKPAEAMSLLFKGKDIEPQADKVLTEEEKLLKYDLRKNLGWARFQQERYREAEVLLKEAIDIDNTIAHNVTRGSAYCLLAQVLEAQVSEKTSPLENTRIQQWKLCRENVNQRVPEEDMWKAMAQQRLKKGEQ